MIWLLVILFPLLAAVFAALIPAGRKGTGLIFVLAALPALWLGLTETAGVTVQWPILETFFYLDTPRRILLLLTAILWAAAGPFAGSYMKNDSRRREFSVYFGAAMAGNFGLLISGEEALF